MPLLYCQFTGISIPQWGVSKYNLSSYLYNKLKHLQQPLQGINNVLEHFLLNIYPLHYKNL